MTGNDTTIIVNNKAHRTDQSSLTGAAIKTLAGVPATYELYLTHEPGSGPTADRQVPDSESVALRNGMKFRAIPAGNQG